MRGIIESGAENPHAGLASRHLGGKLANNLNLVVSQAHAFSSFQINFERQPEMIITPGMAGGLSEVSAIR